MPKARKEEILSDDGVTKKVRVMVGQPDGGTKPAEYEIPSNPKVWQELVLGLSEKSDKDGEESPLARAYRLFVSAIDKQARQAAYEQAAQESTFITVGKERKDIMEFPVPNLVRAINGMRAQVETRTLMAGGDEDAKVAAEKSVGYGPWRTAARKLVELGKAKENTDAGVLELVA